jgi:hypothetical protein
VRIAVILNDIKMNAKLGDCVGDVAGRSTLYFGDTRDIINISSDIVSRRNPMGIDDLFNALFHGRQGQALCLTIKPPASVMGPAA